MMVFPVAVVFVRTESLTKSWRPSCFSARWLYLATWTATALVLSRGVRSLVLPLLRKGVTVASRTPRLSTPYIVLLCLIPPARHRRVSNFCRELSMHLELCHHSVGT